MTIKVSVKDVSKEYDLYQNKSDRIKALVDKRKKPQHFWALRHISFDVHEGETVGLIGVNGSGKSTVSSVIAGISPATKGEIEINGEVSMIAIGAGLKGPLTGVENIRMKCLMLGYSMKKINQLMPEIIAFSDLGDFINQPVKSYSSGMKSRLGFAIAVHIDPDILVIDEALSVGDKTFYQKCVDKIMDFKAQGKTIFFVSHSLAQVKSLCDRIVWMHYGELRMDGPAAEVAKEYDAYVKWFNGLKPAEKTAYQQECKAKQKRPYIPLEVQNPADKDSRLVRNQATYEKLQKKGSLWTPVILVLLAFVIITSGIAIASNKSLASMFFSSVKTEEDAKTKTPVKLVWENVSENARFNKNNVELYTDETLKTKASTKVIIGQQLAVKRQSDKIVEISFEDGKYYVEKGNFQYKSDSIVQDNVEKTDFVDYFNGQIATSIEYFTAYLGRNKTDVITEMNSKDIPEDKVISLYDGQLKYHYDEADLITSIQIETKEYVSVEALDITKSQTLFDSKDKSYFFEGLDYQYRVTKETVSFYNK
ncbi:techoic acid ABC transporter ATP-binding protein [Brochothrix campestris FSL F6-1037]|uniref:Techoic acid ABC transporter ATP-binding protein n=1 Tax=Brochothrix campestris FSL F6-1037 TaxID=1265861 RepID=W7D1J0_9LIST|nr:techoic acid ABC transporter ATP-binding protein [Brochothrix campestris FSL F6-1037]